MHDDRPSSITRLQDGQRGKNVARTMDASSDTDTPSPEPHSADDGPEGHSIDNSTSHQGAVSTDNPTRPPPSIPLQRSVYIVFLTLLYGAAALYAWVTICILTSRPIGGISYGFDNLEYILQHRDINYTVPEYLDAFFARSERYLRVARIVQSLVSVLTIPLTSAVCSQAAVVYIQRRRGGTRLTLRQSMALADRGWTDLGIIGDLMWRGWNRYRSSLLLFALALHFLGGAVSPIQQLLLSFQTIKRPTFPVHLTQITDFSGHLSSAGET
ncbi:hypothetical protein VE02_07335 [Pseudogymnoascus sp. 03VT05]|nr:hypothetical protein VE02_07335 [Pseudogymnoascus sp. 03VT05]